jgi:hypothetical protein
MLRGVRKNFIQYARQIDQRGSSELGVKTRYLRKPKYLQRPKSMFGRYESPWRSVSPDSLSSDHLRRSNKKNVQDALFLLCSNVKNFFKQKKLLNVPEIPQMAVNADALRTRDKDHFTWVH